MAQKACPDDNTHIVLNRPHTVLLLALMREGSAKRGAYTDAMATELKRADGRAIADYAPKRGSQDDKGLWRRLDT